MKCPNCNSVSHYVQTTRHLNETHSIKRARICKTCDFRWMTEEVFVRTRKSIPLIKKGSNTPRGCVSYYDTTSVYPRSFLFSLLFMTYQLSTKQKREGGVTPVPGHNPSVTS